jgi:hypothetical protein
MHATVLLCPLTRTGGSRIFANVSEDLEVLFRQFNEAVTARISRYGDQMDNPKLPCRQCSRRWMGDGVGTSLLGLVLQATAYDPAGATAEASKFTVLLNVIAKPARADVAATGVVVNLTDWLRL